MAHPLLADVRLLPRRVPVFCDVYLSGSPHWHRCNRTAQHWLVSGGRAIGQQCDEHARATVAELRTVDPDWRLAPIYHDGPDSNVTMPREATD